jgi:hypothetical protein
MHAILMISLHRDPLKRSCYADLEVEAWFAGDVMADATMMSEWVTGALKKRKQALAFKERVDE